tara:strand:+ start:1036 stop:2037 length:1002 start_codon:yes stop_codon:yes gene_type:complete
MKTSPKKKKLTTWKKVKLVFAGLALIGSIAGYVLPKKHAPDLPLWNIEETQKNPTFVFMHNCYIFHIFNRFKRFSDYYRRNRVDKVIIAHSHIPEFSKAFNQYLFDEAMHLAGKNATPPEFLQFEDNLYTSTGERQAFQLAVTQYQQEHGGLVTALSVHSKKEQNDLEIAIDIHNSGWGKNSKIMNLLIESHNTREINLNKKRYSNTRHSIALAWADPDKVSVGDWAYKRIQTALWYSFQGQIDTTPEKVYGRLIADIAIDLSQTDFREETLGPVLETIPYDKSNKNFQLGIYETLRKRAEKYTFSLREQDKQFLENMSGLTMNEGFALTRKE